MPNNARGNFPQIYSNKNIKNNLSLYGNSTFKLTAPAMVAVVGYVILGIVVLLPYDMYVYDESSNTYEKRPYNAGTRILLLLLLLFPFILGVYTINCMIVGDCKIWSWIVAIVTLLWAGIVIISAITYRSFRLDDMLV